MMIGLLLASWSVASCNVRLAPLQRPTDTLRLYAVGDINLGRRVAKQRLLEGDTLYPVRAPLDVHVLPACGRGLGGVGRPVLDLSRHSRPEGERPGGPRRGERPRGEGVRGHTARLPPRSAPRPGGRGRRPGARPSPPRVAAGRVVPGQADRAVARQFRVRAGQPVDAALGRPAGRGRPRQDDATLRHSGPRRPSTDGGDRRRGRQRPPPTRHPSLDGVQTMTEDTLDFLKRLLDTPGPSGFETAPARVWRDHVKGFTDQVTSDVHGNSVAALNPKGTPRLMLAGHIDEIGLQITHVDDEGYLYFAAIGGWDSQVLVGQRVVITGPKGPVRGVIGKQAVHLMKREDLDKVSKITDLWIDVGTGSKAETLERVHIGDPAVLDAEGQEFPNGRIVSRSIDNRIGAYLVAEAARLLAQDRPKHAAVFAVAAARGEIPWTGGGARTRAGGIEPTA